MNVSSRQGCGRWAVMQHRSSYSAYGSRPDSSPGDLIPNWRRSAATAGPTLGMSSSRAMSSRLADGGVVDAFRFIVVPSHDGPDHAAIDTQRRPVGGRGPWAAHIGD